MNTVSFPWIRTKGKPITLYNFISVSFELRENERTRWSTLLSKRGSEKRLKRRIRRNWLSPEVWMKEKKTEEKESRRWPSKGSNSFSLSCCSRPQLCFCCRSSLESKFHGNGLESSKQILSWQTILSLGLPVQANKKPFVVEQMLSVSLFFLYFVPSLPAWGSRSKVGEVQTRKVKRNEEDSLSLTGEKRSVYNGLTREETRSLTIQLNLSFSSSSPTTTTRERFWHENKGRNHSSWNLCVHDKQESGWRYPSNEWIKNG